MDDERETHHGRRERIGRDASSVAARVFEETGVGTSVVVGLYIGPFREIGLLGIGLWVLGSKSQ